MLDHERRSLVHRPEIPAPLGRLQTLRIASSSVAPVQPGIETPCVLTLLGFRSPKQHRIPRTAHSRSTLTMPVVVLDEKATTRFELVYEALQASA